MTPFVEGHERSERLDLSWYHLPWLVSTSRQDREGVERTMKKVTDIVLISMLEATHLTKAKPFPLFVSKTLQQISVSK